MLVNRLTHFQEKKRHQNTVLRGLSPEQLAYRQATKLVNNRWFKHFECVNFRADILSNPRVSILATMEGAISKRV